MHQAAMPDNVTRGRQSRKWDKKDPDFDIYAPNDSDLEDVDDMFYGRPYLKKPAHLN